MNISVQKKIFLITFHDPYFFSIQHQEKHLIKEKITDINIHLSYRFTNIHVYIDIYMDLFNGMKKAVKTFIEELIKY